MFLEFSKLRLCGNQFNTLFVILSDIFDNQIPCCKLPGYEWLVYDFIHPKRRDFCPLRQVCPVNIRQMTMWARPLSPLLHGNKIYLHNANRYQSLCGLFALFCTLTIFQSFYHLLCGFHNFTIYIIARQQFFMRATADAPASIHHKNVVGVFYRIGSLGYDDCRFGCVFPQLF